MPDTHDDGRVPLRQRSIPDQLDHFGDKLGGLLDRANLDRDMLIVIGAAVVNLGAIAAQLRKQGEQLAAATARAEKAERQFNLVRSLNRLAKANAVELHAQLDAVRARIAELGKPEVEQRIVSPSGLVYEPTLRDLENQAYWLPGVRLEERQVYPTPWREAADATQDGLSATETDDGASQAPGVELEFGSASAGLSERCPCGCPKIGDGCNCRFCSEPYPTQQPSDDTNGADR